MNQIAVSAPSGTLPTILVSGQNNPYGISTDSKYVYWTNYYGRTVNQITVGGGTSITLVSNQGEPIGIATDGINVYWTSGSSVNQIAAINGACAGQKPMCFGL